MNNKLPYTRLNSRGFVHKAIAVFMGLILSFGIIGTFHSVSNHVSADGTVVKSGVSGYCLDDHNSDTQPGAEVDSYKCNNTDAQGWTLTSAKVEHNNLCLSVQGNSTADNTAVDLENCTDAAGQVWLSDNNGLFNPNSTKCLSLPNGQTGQSLILSDCNQLGKPSETWLPTSSGPTCASISDQGLRVSCYAEKEWTTWESGKINHNTLLNSYTDGAPYEEWCADFVSYVYKESGYAFTQGEANGWDESNANDIQYQGFVKHSAANYTPQPGDVAFFDYSGGHVELVVSGGKHPTFIYGNSGTIDPTTGNGEMEANTLTSDGSLGSLQYYLSPIN